MSSVVTAPVVVARTTAGAYAAAGLLIWCLLLLPQEPGAHVGVLKALASVALLASVTAGLTGRRLRPWMIHAIVGGGTALASSAIFLSGSRTLAEAIAVFYVFIAIDSAFFFRTPFALVHLALLTLGCMGSLAPYDPTGFGLGLVFTGASLSVAAVVGWLVRKAATADQDPLTELPNRRGADAYLEDAMLRGRRDADALSVVLIDVDHFKNVNDTLGHAAGDRLLTEIARSWRALLEPGEQLARIGGDEFVAILPGADLQRGLALADALLHSLPGGHTASIGVAQWDGTDSASLLLAAADTALYRAKRDGRNCTRWHETGSRRAEEELADALAAGQLFVLYQPVVGLADGRAVGAEALVRWNHPERGVLTPDSFIPLAEETGLVAELGQFVLEQACREAVRWRATPGAPRTVSVNVSGRELECAGYLHRVEQVLLDTGLPARALVLEVTESSLPADAATALLTLSSLRATGVRVAIDDFGTGYSTLSRLAHLPVDLLKIDKSFVRDIVPGVDSPVIAAVSALAAALHLTVIAEGVETVEQADVLTRLHCQLAQGYLYSRPVASADLLDARALATDPSTTEVLAAS